MEREKGLSRVSTIKRARELEREREDVEREGALAAWRRNRRPAFVVTVTLPLAVAAVIGTLTLVFTQVPQLALIVGAVVYVFCLIVVVGIMGALVATDAAFAEGRKGIARRRIVQERRDLLDASEVAGGVEIAREADAGGELSPADPAGGLTPTGDRSVDQGA